MCPFWTSCDHAWPLRPPAERFSVGFAERCRPSRPFLLPLRSAAAGSSRLQPTFFRAGSFRGQSPRSEPFSAPRKLFASCSFLVRPTIAFLLHFPNETDDLPLLTSSPVKLRLRRSFCPGYEKLTCSAKARFERRNTVS